MHRACPEPSGKFFTEVRETVRGPRTSGINFEAIFLFTKFELHNKQY